MKKALIVTAFAGFIKSFLDNDIMLLQEMGYEVHCAANKYHAGAEEIDDYFEKKKIIFHQIDFSSNKPISRETLVSYKQISDLLKKYYFDVIHSHTPIAGAVTRLACRRQRKQGSIIIYTTHGFYFHKYSSKKTWLIFYSIEDLMSRYSDAIITINYEDYYNAKLMHCKKVYHIPGVGVDTKRFSDTLIDRDMYRRKIGIKKEDLLILAIGELSHRKNHQIIIKALSRAKLPNVVFMICGNAMTEDNTKSELEEMAKRLNVDLRLMGLRDDIPQICKSADIGVMPSSREGLGLAGIEMLAAGLPVVASNVHGIVDYINDGENGYLCPYNDSLAFAKAISKLQTKDVRESMRKKCMKSAQSFDREYSYRKMKKIYEELLN
ncbi:MAG TPA: glycosyltransferase [Candidatus Anaerostipes avicola]|nr:glycosyltransferase [uncultured Anaerostipes sp.]HJC83769.1 glycosyltransferase [Candidatus Anaerostipes avicola]